MEFLIKDNLMIKSDLKVNFFEEEEEENDEKEIIDISHALYEDILKFSKDNSLSIMEIKMVTNNNNTDYGSDTAIDLKVVYRVTPSYVYNKSKED